MNGAPIASISSHARNKSKSCGKPLGTRSSAGVLQQHDFGTLVNLMHRAMVYGSIPRKQKAADPTDSYLLDLIDAAQPDYAVTGDKRSGLLQLGILGRTRILNAGRFVSKSCTSSRSDRRTNGYYTRVLSKDDEYPAFDELAQLIRGEHPEFKLTVEAGTEEEWDALLLSSLDEVEVALIERNPVSDGSTGQDEIADLVEDLHGCKPNSGVQWLENYLTSVKTVYSLQHLQGAELADGGNALHALRWPVGAWGRDHSGRRRRLYQRGRLPHCLAVLRLGLRAMEYGRT